MKPYVIAGFHAARRQPFAIGALFLFHFFWSMWLYRFVEDRVIAVMRRFPPPEFSGERVELFLNESALLLFKTDLAAPTLWALAAFAAVRLLVLPLLHAGVYESLHRQGPRGTVFIAGIRKHGGVFALLALLRAALTVLPLYWVLPYGWARLLDADSFTALAVSVLPLLVGLTLYGGLIKLLFMYAQFGRTAETGMLGSLWLALRRLLPVSAIALTVYAAALLAGTLVFSAAVFWAGFAALLLHLAYPLLKMLLKVWDIAAQHQFWREKRELRM